MVEKYSDFQEREMRSWFPTTIDVNPTARCNLDCSFCWGPDHSIPDGLNTEQWIDAIDYFSARGTRGIVFTGGEPLLRPDIGDLIRHAKLQDMRVTLSTNTLLLARRAEEVLPHIDEIGIPMDGSTIENNIRMRIGTKKHFNTVLDSLDLIKSTNLRIETTVRTVVSAVNIDDILSIGALLSQHSDKVDRWKIYQFTPVSIGATHRDEHQVSNDKFHQVAIPLLDTYSSMNIQVYPSEQRVGRYVFLGPEGNVFGVGDDGDYQTVGNLLSSSQDEIYQGIQQLVRPGQNLMHGQL